MKDYEKLGMFYLGREFDMESGTSGPNLLYDSKDLTTHALVVGMTGSGKTGLCVGLLEEAGMDRIPAIVIDPKGDIANLLLTFENLDAESFRPWIDESEARRKEMSPDEFAAHEAAKWKKGIESWNQDEERIRTLRNTVDFRVYTPGSQTGRPLTILKSFAAPEEAIMNNPDAIRDRIGGATSGLLALMGIDADPIQSREYIIISKIFEHAWNQGRDLDLAKLIAAIQAPPFDRIGAMELDAVFSKKERNSLAMQMNNLLASPSFSSWLTGEPLDIKQMLHSDGKPCISVLSISHLSEKERMFFVTVLLNEVVAWMRTQSGTSSLRALLYMDEVFGYFPPTKNPPSKQPMLTLLKQARAYGLGVVLATQNPVDLDYKGLSNCGTWFLGRLQTERDKMRVLEGLEGAAAQSGSTFDRGEMEEVLAGLGKRKFLMNNVHDSHPVVFETRWVMSYLRGPLTRNQIRTLIKENGFDSSQVTSESVSRIRDSGDSDSASSNDAAFARKPEIDPRQLVPSDIGQAFVAPAVGIRQGDRIVYRPALIGRGRLHYVRATYKVDKWVEKIFLAPIRSDDIPPEVWDDAEEIRERWDFEEPDEDATFADLPGDLQKAKNYKTWNKELKEFLYRGQPMTVWKCLDPKKYSGPGQTLSDFKVDLEQLVSEERDEKTEKLRKRYAKKFSTLRDKIRRAEDRIEREEDQYKNARMDSVLSVGSSLLGSIFGRRSTRASTSMRRVGRASQQRSDIGRAKDAMESLQDQFEDMEREFADEVEKLEDKLSVENLEFDELSLPPRKSDISIEQFGVCWLPWRVDSTGIAEPVY